MFQSIQVTFIIFGLGVAIVFVVRIGHFLVVIITEPLFPRESFLRGRYTTNIQLLGYRRRRKKRSNNRRVHVSCIMLSSFIVEVLPGYQWRSIIILSDVCELLGATGADRRDTFDE